MKVRTALILGTALVLAISASAVAIAKLRDPCGKLSILRPNVQCEFSGQTSRPNGSIREPDSAATVTSPLKPRPRTHAHYPSSEDTGAKGPLTKVGPGGLIRGPGWTFNAASGLVAGDGAVLEDLDIPYGVDVVGNDVTIRNSRITVGGETMGIGMRHAKNTLVEDTTIKSDGKSRLMVAVKDVYGDASGTMLRRMDISGASTAIQMDEGVLEDSYLHDPQMQDGDHVNGITSNGGSSPLVIRHNTILNPFSQTDAISLFQDFGVQQNRIIEHNLIAGGGYAIYGGAGKKGKTSNIKIRNNHFSTIYFPQSGHWGPVAYFAAEDVGNDWHGNVWADGPKAGQQIDG